MPELNKTPIAKEQTKLEQADLVEVVGTDGGTIEARLISNPAGTNDHYADTRDENGKLVIGRKLDYAG